MSPEFVADFVAGTLAFASFLKAGLLARLGLTKAVKAMGPRTYGFCEVSSGTAVTLQEATAAAEALGYSLGKIKVMYVTDYGLFGRFFPLFGKFAAAGKVCPQPVIGLGAAALKSLRKAVSTIAHELEHSRGFGELQAITAEKRAEALFDAARRAGKLP